LEEKKKKITGNTAGVAGGFDALPNKENLTNMAPRHGQAKEIRKPRP